MQEEERIHFQTWMSKWEHNCDQLADMNKTFLCIYLHIGKGCARGTPAPTTNLGGTPELLPPRHCRACGLAARTAVQPYTCRSSQVHGCFPLRATAGVMMRSASKNNSWGRQAMLHLWWQQQLWTVSEFPGGKSPVPPTHPPMALTARPFLHVPCLQSPHPHPRSPLGLPRAKPLKLSKHRPSTLIQRIQ